VGEGTYYYLITLKMKSLDLVSFKRWKWTYLATSLELTWEKIKMGARK
jgi:hypothetical protein